MTEVINYAKQRGIEELALETDNAIAITLYEKLGFKYNDLMMSKVLREDNWKWEREQFYY